MSERKEWPKSFSWEYDASDIITFSDDDGVQRDRWGIAWQYHETQMGNYAKSWIPVSQPQVAELPPTTADLASELTAYRQFAADIDAAFAKPSPRGLQLDYQHAFDRLRASIKEQA